MNSTGGERGEGRRAEGKEGAEDTAEGGRRREAQRRQRTGGDKEGQDEAQGEEKGEGDRAGRDVDVLCFFVQDAPSVEKGVASSASVMLMSSMMAAL